jgi:beta-glucosidase
MFKASVKLQPNSKFRWRLGCLLFLAIGCTASHGHAPSPDSGTDSGTDAFDFSSLNAGILNAPVTLSGINPATERAKELLKTLSTDEKIKLVHGIVGSYVGNVPAVASLPALTLQDGPAGVARFNDVTVFPAPITLAASWNRDLVERWGAAMAAEERGKGVMIQLGPMMNMVREPAAGRNFESFGEDPFLSAELSVADVTGMQSQKVVATAKHYIGNEQETNRMSVDSQIDERTLHEIYDAPFVATVNAGVGAVMCSYNRLNGIYACENPTTLADLKEGMGFTGFVMSDWGATHSTVQAANAGLDMEMPSGDYFGSALASAISDGNVAQDRLDDMVTRILTSLIRVGVLDDPPSGDPSSIVTSSEHDALATEAATAGITLLQNNGAALPLDTNVKSIAVIGSAGGDTPFSVGGGSAQVNVRTVVSPFSAIKAQAPSSTSVSYVRGDNGGNQDDAVAAATAADAAVIFAAVGSNEGDDRNSLALSSEVDALITAVAAVNPRTIVVLHVPGAVLMPWLDRVSAVLVAWFPGEQNGNAITPILFGSINPSGKLPVTFPRSANDLPRVSSAPAVPYSEGLAIGYRAFDAQGIAPMFPFGHGLSYTTFAYSNLSVHKATAPGTIEVQFAVRNTGSRAGAEVAQLYLSFPESTGEPPRLLRGFERVTLSPGETRNVTMTLGPKDLSCWNPTAHARYVPSGTFTMAVGSSSRDLPLQSSAQVVGFGPQN